MRNLWSDEDARAAVERYAAQGMSEDLALRVYTSRLLGGDARLVLHGGGNTSVKTEMADLVGERVAVICVKGSGWDMAAIEPPGLPAVRLEPLRRLAQRDALGDEDMVAIQRTNLLDPAAPNPSVETLLHAFLPEKFVDHTHANAVLALIDQPDGARIAADVYQARAALVDYVMPGFALAKQAHAVYLANPGIEGLILLKHGIFTFGASAKQAYGRMIDLVTLAERHLAKVGRKRIAQARLPGRVANVAEVAPILRGLASLPAGEGAPITRFVFDYRTSATVRAYVGGRDVTRYSQQGTVTPDHAIRTKPKPMVAPAPRAGKLVEFAGAAARAMAAYRADYQAYFARNDARQATPRVPLDAAPRVILVPGLGLFGIGATAREAAQVADLAEANAEVITAAEALGRFESVSEAELFDIEYWSLEQAKIGRTAEKRLARHVVVVTGGGSGIGRATAEAFAAEGAEVAVLDVDGAAAEASAARLGGLGIACDVTDGRAVKRAFDRVSSHFGGCDVVVSNAGAAWHGEIGTVGEAVLRKSFELNFFAHQHIAQNAVRVMRAQRLGGCLLFNISKQALNPGPDFGPYGIAKAATLALMRQYAVDHGKDSIRANGLNADRVRTGLMDRSMIAHRAKARGVSAAAYMAGNLLGREVTADDVGRAFVQLSLAAATTGAVITVDGGNIAAAPR
ncbi:MAG TPA: bifunctional aldolase/short-chain dehydrogenase [Rhodospirillales bacterium]|nr:bifunctional aldolase/short-chain dehydrogenase [Rhodospirillales bacterium]HJO69113.1 bifunctional aldolase/short-chain dehydrogenase [Rhodospirillales bacterium]